MISVRKRFAKTAMIFERKCFFLFRRFEGRFSIKYKKAFASSGEIKDGSCLPKSRRVVAGKVGGGGVVDFS